MAAMMDVQLVVLLELLLADMMVVQKVVLMVSLMEPWKVVSMADGLV